MRLYRKLVFLAYEMCRHWMGKPAVLLILIAFAAIEKDTALYGMAAACFLSFFTRLDPLRALTLVGPVMIYFLPRVLRETWPRTPYLYELMQKSGKETGFGTIGAASLATACVFLILIPLLMRLCGRSSEGLRRIRPWLLASPLLAVLFLKLLVYTEGWVFQTALTVTLFFAGSFAALIDYLNSADRRRFHWSHLGFFYTCWSGCYISFLRFPTYLEGLTPKTKRAADYARALGLATLLIAALLKVVMDSARFLWPLTAVHMFWNYRANHFDPYEIRVTWLLTGITAVGHAAAYNLTFVSIFRLMGYRLPTTPNYPWRATSFSDIYRRLYYNFTRFILDNYFHPIFVHLNQLPRHLRVAAAAILALFTGTFLFHLAHDGLAYLAVGEGRLVGYLPFLTYVSFFAALIGAGLARSQSRNTRDISVAARLFNWVVFFLVFSALLFFRPILLSGFPMDNFRLFFELFY